MVCHDRNGSISQFNFTAHEGPDIYDATKICFVFIVVLKVIVDVGSPLHTVNSIGYKGTVFGLE